MSPARPLAVACALTLAAGAVVAARALPSHSHHAPARLPASAAAAPVHPAPVAPSRHQKIRHQAARTLYPIPAGPVAPQPCPPPYRPPGPPPPPLGPPQVAESAVPVVGPPPPRRVDLAPIAGKGIWLTVWAGDRVDVSAVVALARAHGLHQLWVRTGGSYQGFYGGPLLSALVPAAHAAGIAVISWDYPTLSNPVTDAGRAAAALRYGVDAFSPDIETRLDGTYITTRRVAYYLSLVRAAAGNRPIVATVPRPTAYRLASYPYATEAQFVDAFAPMVYWSCSEPGAAVSSAIAPLARLRPVAPVGQDYDMGSEGGRPGLPSGPEIWRFLDVAHRAGAIGASLYALEFGGRLQLAALAAYPW